MSAPRDPFDAFCAEFPEFISAQTLLTNDDLDAMAAEYQRDAIASAHTDTETAEDLG